MQQRAVILQETMTNTEWADDFVTTYYEKMYKYCYSILRNVEDAEDAVQDIFLKAIKNKPKTEITHESAWLYKIAYFHCLNKLKRKKLLAFVPFFETESMSFAQHDDDRQLNAILNKLKPEERTLIVLRIIEGYRFEEIAQIMDKPASTIRKRYERLKDKIKKYIEEEHYEGF